MRTGRNRPRQTRKEQVKVPSSSQTLRRGNRIPASPSLSPPTPPKSWDFLLQARKLRPDPHLILQGPTAPRCLQLTSTPDPSGTLSLSCRAQLAPPCPPRSSFTSGHTAEYDAAMKKVLTPAPMGRTLTDRRGHTLYNSISMKHPEQVNPQRQNEDWWLPGAGEGVGNGEQLVCRNGSPFGVGKRLSDRGHRCTTLPRY